MQILLNKRRRRNWNYGHPAIYFIKVDVKTPNCYFGDIVNGNFMINDAGAFLEQEWIKSKFLRKDMNIELKQYHLSPDGFMAILSLNENKFNSWKKLSGELFPLNKRMCKPNSLLMHSSPGNTFGQQTKNVGSLIRGFKGAVSRYMFMNGYADFCWKARYMDYVIRSTEELYYFEELFNEYKMVV
jgi:hypothetical protein